MTPVESASYYSTRYRSDPKRRRVWEHICTYLETWIPAGSDVLELGAGYCDFSNSLGGRTVTAMDIDPELPTRVGPGVKGEIGDCSDLSRFPGDSFDVVFASNLLEHLDRPATEKLLAESRRVLRPGGRLILIQPNFRLRPGEYFDDYTHVSVHTDRSLSDLLAVSGFEVEFSAQFFRSRGSCRCR